MAGTGAFVPPAPPSTPNNDSQAEKDWWAAKMASTGQTSAELAANIRAIESRQSQDPMMEMFNAMMNSGPSGPSQADIDAQRERDRITQGENDRDSAYSNYLNAADAATKYVNKLIENERSNANLLGVNYVMTDEVKSNRINNYFSSIWGEGDQTSLQQLFDEFGDPTGFGGFIVTRGDGEADPGPDAESDSVKQRDMQPEGGPSLATSSLLEETAQELAGSLSTLG